MAFQVIPRELAFFDLFEAMADTVLAGARELQALIDDFPNAAGHNERIQDLEHEGDDLTHQIMSLLNTTFVVPIDRDDIYNLAGTLDDILDEQEAAADLLVLHGISEALPEFRLQVDVLVRAAESIRKAVHGLRSLVGMKKHWVEILRLEKEGDRIYHLGVASLFGGDSTAMQVLKWKDMFDILEQAIDKCEDVANAVESIQLKHA